MKPANIKITEAGLVKLLDFGIARVTVAHDDETRAATEDGQAIGTTAYMSPEQARGQQVDKRTDIWSYGCDNRAIAYSSNRAGRVDVYVASLAAPAAAVTVSPGGGYFPRWSRDGRELMCLTADQRLMVVPIRTSPSIVAGVATPLFSLSSGAWSDFDPAPDGRLLAILMKQLASEQPIVTILNWRPPGP